MNHGTISSYARGCRCEPCRAAQRDYDKARGYRRPSSYSRANHALLSEALQELLPFGLTNDCPARRALEKTLAEPSTTAGANQPASSRASRRNA